MLLRLLLFIVLFHCDICGLRLWCFGLEVMKHRTCMRLTLEKNLLCLRFGFGKPVWVGFSSWRKPHHTVSWVWNCIAIAKSTWPKPILRTKQVHTLGKLDRRESAPPNQTKFLPNFTRNYFCGYSVSVAAVLQNYTGKVTLKCIAYRAHAFKFTCFWRCSNYCPFTGVSDICIWRLRHEEHLASNCQHCWMHRRACTSWFINPALSIHRQAMLRSNRNSADSSSASMRASFFSPDACSRDFLIVWVPRIQTANALLVQTVWLLKNHSKSWLNWRQSSI